MTFQSFQPVVHRVDFASPTGFRQEKADHYSSVTKLAAPTPPWEERPGGWAVHSPLDVKSPTTALGPRYSPLDSYRGQPSQIFRWAPPSRSNPTTYVLNAQGGQLFTISMPRKKTNYVSDSVGNVVADIQWSEFMSKPTISLRGSNPIRIKDWLPCDSNTQCRTAIIGGQTYYFQVEGGTAITKTSWERFWNEIGARRDAPGLIELELAADEVVHLEDFVIIATALHGSRKIDKGDFFDKFTDGAWAFEVFGDW